MAKQGIYLARDLFQEDNGLVYLVAPEEIPQQMHGVGYLLRIWVGGAAQDKVGVYHLGPHVSARVGEHGFRYVEDIRGPDARRLW